MGRNFFGQAEVVAHLDGCAAIGIFDHVIGVAFAGVGDFLIIAADQTLDGADGALGRSGGLAGGNIAHHDLSLR